MAGGTHVSVASPVPASANTVRSPQRHSSRILLARVRRQLLEKIHHRVLLESLRTVGAYVMSLRLRFLIHVLWMVPVVVWIIQVLYVFPMLSSTNAEGQLSIWMGLLLTAGPVMLAAEIVALFILTRYRAVSRVPLVCALVLNLTPLYYLKIIVVGLSVNKYF